MSANPKPTLYKINLPTAVNYTKRWREKQSEDQRPQHKKVKAFTVDVEELKQVISELGVKKVRLYLAINDEKKETLVLVGVDGNNADLVLLPGFAGDGTEPDTGTYDFTHPCPDTCASGQSPLLS